MKIRTLKFIAKEGTVNAYRNKLMSLASISMVITSLLIFGIFFIMIENLGFNTESLKKQPSMQIFCDPELDSAGTTKIENILKADTRVAEYKMVTKQEAYEKIEEMLGDSSEILEGIDNFEFLPVSFVVKLNDPEQSLEFISEIKMVEGVDNVRHVQKTIDVIEKIAGWVQIVSSILLVIMLSISVFIIANTIKITVFARRRDISIMKYIGATDWFIRWPFIVEGVIIGLIGSVIAFLLAGYIYNTIEIKYSAEIFNSVGNILKLVKFRAIEFEMLVYFILIGFSVGAAGSFISIRRYLKV
jgi:cell division transport system permease protein